MYKIPENAFDWTPKNIVETRTAICYNVIRMYMWREIFYTAVHAHFVGQT